MYSCAVLSGHLLITNLPKGPAQFGNSNGLPSTLPMPYSNQICDLQSSIPGNALVHVHEHIGIQIDDVLVYYNIVSARNDSPTYYDCSEQFV